MSGGVDVDGAALVRIARSALEAAAAGDTTEPAVETGARAQRPGASFVTLVCDGELRGCIGSLEAHWPLDEDVRRNARAAALHDTRFPPVRPEELDRIAVEVSVLSELQKIEHYGEEDLLARLRPGVDGLVIAHDGRRATFLPQVWSSLPTPSAFLRALKLKAGLRTDVPIDDLQAWRFTVEKYRE